MIVFFCFACTIVVLMFSGTPSQAQLFCLVSFCILIQSVVSCPTDFFYISGSVPPLAGSCEGLVRHTEVVSQTCNSMTFMNPITSTTEFSDNDPWGHFDSSDCARCCRPVMCGRHGRCKTGLDVTNGVVWYFFGGPYFDCDRQSLLVFGDSHYCNVLSGNVNPYLTLVIDPYVSPSTSISTDLNYCNQRTYHTVLSSQATVWQLTVQHSGIVSTGVILDVFSMGECICDADINTGSYYSPRPVLLGKVESIRSDGDMARTSLLDGQFACSARCVHGRLEHNTNQPIENIDYPGYGDDITCVCDPGFAFSGSFPVIPSWESNPLPTWTVTNDRCAASLSGPAACNFVDSSPSPGDGSCGYDPYSGQELSGHCCGGQTLGTCNHAKFLGRYYCECEDGFVLNSITGECIRSCVALDDDPCDLLLDEGCLLIDSFAAHHPLRLKPSSACRADLGGACRPCDPEVDFCVPNGDATNPISGTEHLPLGCDCPADSIVHPHTGQTLSNQWLGSTCQYPDIQIIDCSSVSPRAVADQQWVCTRVPYDPLVDVNGRAYYADNPIYSCVIETLSSTTFQMYMDIAGDSSFVIDRQGLTEPVLLTGFGDIFQQADQDTQDDMLVMGGQQSSSIVQLKPINDICLTLFSTVVANDDFDRGRVFAQSYCPFPLVLNTLNDPTEPHACLQPYQGSPRPDLLDRPFVDGVLASSYDRHLWCPRVALAGDTNSPYRPRTEGSVLYLHSELFLCDTTLVPAIDPSRSFVVQNCYLVFGNAYTTEVGSLDFQIDPTHVRQAIENCCQFRIDRATRDNNREKYIHCFIPEY